MYINAHKMSSFSQFLRTLKPYHKQLFFYMSLIIWLWLAAAALVGPFAIRLAAGFGDLLMICGSNDLGGEPSQSDSLLVHDTGRLSKSQ